MVVFWVTFPMINNDVCKGAVEIGVIQKNMLESSE